MISHPPARAAPLTAAMIGFGKCRWVIPAKPPGAPMMAAPSPEANALRSMPAEKALSPAPVTTTTAAVVIGLELVQRVRHAGADVAVDGVARLGSVDGEDLDVSDDARVRLRPWVLLPLGRRESDRTGPTPPPDTACPARPGVSLESIRRPVQEWGARHLDGRAHEVAPRHGPEHVRRRRRGDLRPVGEPGDDRCSGDRPVAPECHRRRHHDGAPVGLGRPPARPSRRWRAGPRRCRRGETPSAVARRRRCPRRAWWRTNPWR